MISCVNCNSEISEDREVCPKCETPIEESKKKEPEQPQQPQLPLAQNEGSADGSPSPKTSQEFSIAEKLTRIIEQNDAMLEKDRVRDEEWRELVAKLIPLIEQVTRSMELSNRSDDGGIPS